MATQFVTRQFADDSITNDKIAPSAVGGTEILNGAITNTKISGSANIATSKLADGADFLQRDGSVALTGDLDANGNKITDLAAPTSANDAARKAYVDAVAAGTIDFKNSCRLTTTQDLDTNSSISGTPTYNNTGGTSGTGQITATLSVSDTFTVDGVSLGSADDGTRILIKDESGGLGADANGIYTTTISGTSLTLDRATDFDEDSEVTAGAYMFISEGTDNADSAYVLSTNDPITIGTGSGTNLTFVQFSGAGQITAGDGLAKTGNTLDVDLLTNSGLTFQSNQLAVVDGLGSAGAGELEVQRSGSSNYLFIGISSDFDNQSGDLVIANNAVDEFALASSVAGDGLAGGGGSALSVNAGTGLEIDTDNVRLAAQGNGIAGGAGSVLSVDSDTETGGDILGVNITANGVGVDVDALDGAGLTPSGSATLDLNVYHEALTNDGSASSSLTASPMDANGASQKALIVTLNGQVLDEGDDYTVSGSTINWQGTEPSGDVVNAFYFV